MISSIVASVCSALAEIPYVGSLFGQACGSIVSLLQSLGL